MLSRPLSLSLYGKKRRRKKNWFDQGTSIVRAFPWRVERKRGPTLDRAGQIRIILIKSIRTRARIDDTVEESSSRRAIFQSYAIKEERAFRV